MSETISFADDTNVIISSSNYKYLCSKNIFVLSHIIKWFAVNNLVLNLDKTNIIKILTKN